MTEREALELVNDKYLTKLSLDTIDEAIHSLAVAAADRGDNLEEKVLGEYSYYEGQVNAFIIAKKLLEKLEGY